VRTTATLLSATAASRYAPSLTSEPPWRWEILGGVAELWARHDPRSRLGVLSCGAALHHARVALTADGHTSATTRMPDPDRPALLAELRVTGTRAARSPDLRRYRSMLTGTPDQGAVPRTTISESTLDRLRWAAERYGAHLRILGPDEAAHLTPDDAERRAVHPGTRLAVLHADAGTALDWLIAGEALGEILLTAQAGNVTVSADHAPDGPLAGCRWPILTLRISPTDHTFAPGVRPESGRAGWIPALAT
jgi:hypothetical protein